MVYVYLGFRPRYLVLKGVSEDYGSYCFDLLVMVLIEIVQTYLGLQWTETDEPTGAHLDFFGNGFKIRTTGTGINQNDTYIYYVWGDNPYKYCLLVLF